MLFDVERIIAQNMLSEDHVIFARMDKASSEPVVVMEGMTPARLRQLACWCLTNADRQEKLFKGPYHRKGLREYIPKTPEEVEA
tara:strand:+ start:768 stop:1019 length:252 start_codon:yes stop_codon:yes gene_type:complete